MYFSDQIRQIKLKKKKITKEGPLKKTKKERRRRGRRFSTGDKRKERLTRKERLVAARRGRAERRDERRGASLRRAVR